MSTRPILRNAASTASTASASSSNAGRRVHFPPLPSQLVSFHPALSASAYDRSAIVVQANPCALPPRGSRVYALPEPHPSKRPPTPYSRTSNPFDDDGDDDEPTTDESDATPTPKPALLSSAKRASSSKPKPTSFFSPYADMACLQGF